MIDGSDADHLTIQSGAEMQCVRSIIARIDRFLSRLIRSQNRASEQARLFGGDGRNVDVRHNGWDDVAQNRVRASRKKPRAVKVAVSRARPLSCYVAPYYPFYPGIDSMFLMNFVLTSDGR